MNQVAVITGASRGLGYTLAEFLARQSYDLILTARDGQALEESVQNFQGARGHIVPIAGDISDAKHRHKVIQEAQALGGIDLLVNNASMLGPMPPLIEYPLNTLREVLEVNLLAPLAFPQEALPLLIAKRGLVVNLSSDAAIGGYPGWGGYGLSKAALDLASKTLANELKEFGVGVVSVDPGDMRTAMHQEAFPDEDITDRPLPEATLPFWTWLLGQNDQKVSGQRFSAQAERWELVPA